ncbi:MAG: hypothetical protein HYV07_33915 [Deltaproteobacteria bacterium]|nr:hypothetical protein [Deltaproteobacteria bacterium]
MLPPAELDDLEEVVALVYGLVELSASGDVRATPRAPRATALERLVAAARRQMSSGVCF